MEATASSETSVDFQRTTRGYIPEDRTFVLVHKERIVPCMSLRFSISRKNGTYVEKIWGLLGCWLEVSVYPDGPATGYLDIDIRGLAVSLNKY
jgi:hypothetical protein